VFRHDDDVTSAHGCLVPTGDLLVTGSVCAGAEIVASGEVLVLGDVHAATIRSAGRIAVRTSPWGGLLSAAIRVRTLRSVSGVVE
jgi:uncharacterized protein (DUF342 family)